MVKNGLFDKTKMVNLERLTIFLGGGNNSIITHILV